MRRRFADFDCLPRNSMQKVLPALLTRQKGFSFNKRKDSQDISTHDPRQSAQNVNPNRTSYPVKLKSRPVSCLGGDFELVKFDQFKVQKRLGQELCFDKKNNQRVAIKIYQRKATKEAQKLANIKRQINVMKRLDHPGIVKLIQAATQQSRVFIIMQVAGKTSLNSYWKKQQRKISYNQSKVLFSGISQAVAYMHSRNVVHRDLKLDNILIDPDSLVTKIIDFGFSLATKNQKLSVYCGTPSYMAPEIAARSPYFGKPTDVWAMGIILFCLLFGSFPFRASDQKDLYRKIMTGKLKFPEQVSGYFKQKKLISRMLSVRVQDRPTSAQVSSQWESIVGDIVN